MSEKKYLNAEDQKMLLALIDEFGARLQTYGASAYLLIFEFEEKPNEAITAFQRHASISTAIGMAEFAKARLCKEGSTKANERNF